MVPCGLRLKFFSGGEPPETDSFSSETRKGLLYRMLSCPCGRGFFGGNSVSERYFSGVSG